MDWLIQQPNKQLVEKFRRFQYEIAKIARPIDGRDVHQDCAFVTALYQVKHLRGLRPLVKTQGTFAATPRAASDEL